MEGNLFFFSSPSPPPAFILESFSPSYWCSALETPFGGWDMAGALGLSQPTPSLLATSQHGGTSPAPLSPCG